jgi:hypothetical protein
VDSAVDVEQIGLTMLLDETLFETGVGMIEADSDRDFELTFKSSTNAVLEALEQLKINELLDVINIPQPNYAIWAFNMPFVAGVSCSITISGRGFGATTVSGFDQSVPMNQMVAAINAIFPNLATFTPNILTLSDRNNLYPELSISPYTDGFEVRGGHMNHSQAKQENFLLYLKNQFNNPSPSHRFPVISNDNFFDNDKKPFSFNSLINYQQRNTSGELTQGKNNASEKPDMNYTYIPFPRLRYVLEKISAKVGRPIRFDFSESAELENLLLWNNQTVDSFTEQWFTDSFTRSIYPAGLAPERLFLNHFVTQIDLNKHVLDETAKDFLTRVGDCLGAYFVAENGAIVFKKKQNVVKGEAIDWTEKRADGFTRKRKKRVGFTLDYTRDEADSVVMAAPNLQKYVSGDGGNVVRVPFHTFPTRTVDGMKIPFSAQQGSTVYDGIGKKSYNFALLFDRGIQTATDGFDYYQADFETPGLSLRFEGSTGLFAHFFEGVVELPDGAIYAFILNLSASELANIRLWQSSKRYFLTETGTVLGVIRNVQFKVSRKGIEAARVEVVAYP